MHCEHCPYFFALYLKGLFRRVGFAHATETMGILIPSNTDTIHEHFDTIEPERTAPEWDFMWNTVIEEGREKKMKSLALSRCSEDFPSSRPLISNDIVLAEGALKVRLMSTQNVFKSLIADK
jgi:transcription factor C subunit 3